jgi:hypothetical protein
MVPASPIPLPLAVETFSRRRVNSRKSRVNFTLGPINLGPPKDSNPLLGNSKNFPNLSDCLLRAENNQISFEDSSPESYPYYLDSHQVDELKSIIDGFVKTQLQKLGSEQVGVPRILTMGFAEQMGDALLEKTAMALASHTSADLLTFNARDFGGMLDGLAKLWFGRPFFHTQTTPKQTQFEMADIEEIVEDDLDLLESEGASPSEKQPDTDRWLSQFLAKQTVFKQKPGPSPPSNQNASAIEGRIKDQVNLFAVLNHLQTCMNEGACTSSTRFIHLSGFGASLSNPIHKAHILKFAREQEQMQRKDPSKPLLILLISEASPKIEESAANSAETTNMPQPFANFLALKSKFERVSEIPNTPEHDSNWLVDRNAFGGLKLFIVPPKDHDARVKHFEQLQKDHCQRVWNFNIRRIEDVLKQLGISTSPCITSQQLESLCKTPLFLSEAMYIGYIAYSRCQDASMKSVDSATLSLAIEQYFTTRELHRNHYLQHHPNNSLKDLQTSSGKKIDPKSLSKYEKRFLPCIVTPGSYLSRLNIIYLCH